MLINDKLQFANAQLLDAEMSVMKAKAGMYDCLVDSLKQYDLTVEDFIGLANEKGWDWLNTISTVKKINKEEDSSISAENFSFADYGDEEPGVTVNTSIRINKNLKDEAMYLCRLLGISFGELIEESIKKLLEKNAELIAQLKKYRMYDDCVEARNKEKNERHNRNEQKQKYCNHSKDKDKLINHIEDIKRDYASYSSNWIARKYNVSVSYMRNFLNKNKIYKDDCRKAYIKSINDCLVNSIAEIREDYKTCTIAELAEKYGVSDGQMSTFLLEHKICEDFSDLMDNDLAKYSDNVMNALTVEKEASDIDKVDFSIAEKFSIANTGLDMDNVYNIKEESVV